MKEPQVVGTEDLITMLPQLAANGAFTLNELIEVVNKFFGMEIEPYEEEWANFPIPWVVNPQLSQAWLNDMMPKPPEPEPVPIALLPDGTPAKPPVKPPMKPGIEIPIPEDPASAQKVYAALKGIEEVGRSILRGGCDQRTPRLKLVE